MAQYDQKSPSVNRLKTPTYVKCFVGGGILLGVAGLALLMLTWTWGLGLTEITPQFFWATIFTAVPFIIGGIVCLGNGFDLKRKSTRGY